MERRLGSSARLGSIVGIALLCAGPAFAVEVAKIPAARDATLLEDPEGALANGSGPHLFAGRNNRGEARRALIEFDVAGHVPPGSTVTNVFLTLWLSQTSSGPQTVSLHRLVADWREGRSSASGGGGAPSEPGDATWLHTSYADGFWAHAGGDVVASSASAVIDGLGSYTWGPTPALIADVQRWLDGPGENHGWQLRGNEAASQTTKRFNSREHTDRELRPVLTIEFVKSRERDESGIRFGRPAP